MASIEQIIKREVNPFDPVTFKAGNFWQEQQDPVLTVEYIHQDILIEIEALLDLVAQDRRTRTLMLYGDSGSGKTYLLGRLKRTFNRKAFFVYIDPFPDSDFIWRHVLRYTVDSLLQVPQGQQESQLLLWLKGLSVFKQRSILERIRGDRQAFIRKLRDTYSTGIYNANEFFSVLYDLLNPELRLLACDWLRGDDLNEEDLKKLRLKSAINTEDAAQKILANFGRIAAETQPIVLCFDQLENIARLPDGNIDLQALFTVNSSIHNQNLKNFLVIISLITDIGRQNADRIHQSDKARIDHRVSLKRISLDLAEALWASRLYPLYKQANPKPPTPIAPLTRKILEMKFPGGKTDPRNALRLGQKLIQGYKVGGKFEEDSVAVLKLLWLEEFNNIQQRVSRIRQFSSQELIRMFQEVLAALQVAEIRPKLLPGTKYGSYSVSYEQPGKSTRVGVVWTEEPHLSNFFYVMNACQKAIQQNLCQTLYLIRAEGVGKETNKGYKLYQQIFTGSPHRRIVPDMTSVYYLATYHSLANAARSGELVVAGETPNINDLEALIRDSQILQNCSLLQDLGIFKDQRNARNGNEVTNNSNGKKMDTLQQLKDFLLTLVTTQQLMGHQVLIQNALNQFQMVNESKVLQAIQQLCQENRIQILNAKASPEAQLVCLVPKG
ncbi:ATP-binding protein [Aerosakkonema funiforme]|uniref:ATP-binding protein n=1 Tax=Aerosakkonema funiforme TaxID=1246630 RepID=UPI0035B8E5A7